MTRIKAVNSSPARFKKSLDTKQMARQFLEMVIAGKIDDAYEKYVSSKGKHHNPYFKDGFPA